MQEYGYTSKQWREEVDDEDKILMVSKRQLDNEFELRQNEKIKNSNKG